MSPSSNVPTPEQIQIRAYELFESRGYEHGRDVDDWLEAEAELRQAQQAGSPMFDERSSAVA
jgi:hypothetical protein